MTIRKLATSILLGGAATALVIGAAPALASTATTFTVTPGGAITAKAGTTTLTDTNTKTTLTCASSSSKGSLKSGSGLPGKSIGKITTLSFSKCVGPLGITFTVKNSHFPWHLNATSTTNGVTKGTITGIHSVLSGPSCSATVDGTSATANNGKVAITYTNSNGDLTVLTTGGNLHVYNVSGCAGLINTGDATTFSGTYVVTPKQTITSP